MDLQGVFVKIRDFIKFKGFLVEFLQSRRSWENQKPPENRQKSGLFWASLDLKSQEKQQKNPGENPAMLACDAKNRHVFKDRAMRNVCDSDSRCGLACDASTRDAKSLATLRLLNELNSEDRGLKVRFSLATIVFETFELILCQMLSSQGKNAPSNPYPHYLVRLATSRDAGRAMRATKLVP